MRSRLPRSWRITSCVAAIATATAVAITAPSAVAAPSRHLLPGSTPQWLGKAHKGGATAADSQVGFGILLKMRNASLAVAKLQQLSSPNSASFRRWLTNADFDALYAPTRSDVTAVQNWLRSQGFTVTSTLPSGMYVEASGTVKQIQKTFGTTLYNYRYQGTTVRSNSTALSLPSSTPAAVSDVVDGVLGLDQGTSLKKPASITPPPSPGSRYGVSPCSTYFGQDVATTKPSAYGTKQPYAVCGYTPAQYQSAYGESGLLRSGVTGKGVTVAITDAYASPTIVGDASKYNKFMNQPQFKPGQFTQVLPGGPKGFDKIAACGGNGWYGEETLDVEAVHAMAPGAKIVYVGAPNCFSGLDDAWASTIDDHLANIITNSWTDGPFDTVAELGQSYVDFYTQFSLEAALTGITVNFSSGDDGDNTSGGTNLAGKSAEFPADSPYVTGVGGTSVEIGSRGRWLGEYGWSTDYAQLSKSSWTPALPGVYSSGAGGGTSRLYGQPFYQKGKVPTSMSHYYGSTPMRVVPDAAMPADPNTGLRVGQTQVFPNGTYWDTYRIGGTSLASPLLAGVFAVADQYAGRSLGFVNPLLYNLIGTSALHDIVAPTKPVAQVRTNFANALNDSQGKTYELQTIDVQSTTLHDVRGYDDETGVGTPYGPAFFRSMAALGKIGGPRS